MGDLMDDDDDFGDIYADVECQASYSINSISCIGNPYTEPKEKGEGKGEDCNYDTNAEQVKNRADEENPSLFNSVCEKSSNSEDYTSDSEDDFNIVLNDEDCKGFSVAADGNGYANQDYLEEGEDDNAFLCVKIGYGKNGWNPGSNSFGGEHGSKVNYSNKYQVYESVDAVSCSSQSARGLWEDNRCRQHKVSNTGQLSIIHSSTNYPVSNGGYGFALPWYRTILDVNIDAFEEKRWMHPGVDISDFFNFGFDEDSWKQYCISLEKLRQQLYLHNRFHNHGFSHVPHVCDIRPGSGRSAEVIAQAGSSSKFADAEEKLLGLPKGRAIQVEDGTGERQSTMDVRRPQIWDSDVVIQINVQDPNENCFDSCEDKLNHVDNDGLGSSIVTNLNVDDVRDVHDFDGCSADESLKDLRSSPMNEILLPVSEPKDDPDDQHNANAQTSEDIAEAIGTVEMVKQENGGVVRKPDQDLPEIEVSGGDHSHFSLTLSCSESESEASQDSVYNLPEVSNRFLSRQSSGANLLDLDAPECKSSERNDAVKKQDNHQHFSRCRSPIWEERKHQNRRIQNVFKATRLPGVNNEADPMARNNFRQIEKQCDFGYNNRHNFLCDQRRKISGHHGGQKFVKIHAQDLSTKIPRFRNGQSFRNEAGPKQRRNWTEENFRERRIYDRNDLDEDWDYGERDISPRGMISFTCGQSRRLFSKYKNLKESSINWRRQRDRIESGKQSNDANFLLDHQHAEYDRPHKYGKSFLVNPKGESFNEEYENCIPSVGRETYLCERRDRYGNFPPMNLDSPRSMEIEDEHWDLNSHHLSYWHNRETYAVNKGRLRNKMSPRSEICDPRLDERYRQHWPELGSEKYMDHWVENNNVYGNVDGDIVYSDDQAHRGWRKYRWKSRILHQVECESILRQHDNSSYVKRSSCSYVKSFRHERLQCNYRSTNGCAASGDVQLGENRSKTFEGETNVSFLNRKPLMTCKAEHDQTARRYSNPADLICGDGKSSGRHPHVDRKLEFLDQKFVKGRKVPRDFNGFQNRRAAQCSNSKLSGKDYDKLLDKFPVTEQNKDFDIEEGQIVPKELIKEGKQEIENAAPKQKMKKRVHFENVQIQTKGYDEQQILDTLAKMERRRQRFEDPIAFKKALGSTLKAQADFISDRAEVENKQERPARKRRWGGQ